MRLLMISGHIHVADPAGGKPRDSLIHAVEGRHPDVDVVFLAEGVEQVLIDVIGVVEDVEDAALLGLQPALDGVLEDRQLHRPVRARQRNAAGTDRGAGGIGESLAPQQAQRDGGEPGGSQRLQGLAAGESPLEKGGHDSAGDAICFFHVKPLFPVVSGCRQAGMCS
jgi:hypothetical protein